ncbi:uncharacterized protein BCR38DRAFT_481919 [Pseudomassariella vexata]|uniref:Uncharacterized protein n=1 Tax=Pseudomassariella vexata TaxID=1141098 RepID=A0A1Y2EA41_9PEZI|nr:uncharacterized protein BCR38DRAFT_481919 [Pseudomassariella vexata]ORY68429.1 hypothetical protein BCR38DRAFT_481919 [Pseudomassariella vexata]
MDQDIETTQDYNYADDNFSPPEDNFPPLPPPRLAPVPIPLKTVRVKSRRRARESGSIDHVAEGSSDVEQDSNIKVSKVRQVFTPTSAPTSRLPSASSSRDISGSSSRNISRSSSQPIASPSPQPIASPSPQPITCPSPQLISGSSRRTSGSSWASGTSTPPRDIPQSTGPFEVIQPRKKPITEKPLNVEQFWAENQKGQDQLSARTQEKLRKQKQGTPTSPFTDEENYILFPPEIPWEEITEERGKNIQLKKEEATRKAKAEGEKARRSDPTSLSRSETSITEARITSLSDPASSTNLTESSKTQDTTTSNDPTDISSIHELPSQHENDPFLALIPEEKDKGQGNQLPEGSQTQEAATSNDLADITPSQEVQSHNKDLSPASTPYKKDKGSEKQLVTSPRIQTSATLGNLTYISPSKKVPSFNQDDPFLTLSPTEKDKDKVKGKRPAKSFTTQNSIPSSVQTDSSSPPRVLIGEEDPFVSSPCKIKDKGKQQPAAPLRFPRATGTTLHQNIVSNIQTETTVSTSVFQTATSTATDYNSVREFLANTPHIIPFAGPKLRSNSSFGNILSGASTITEGSIGTIRPAPPEQVGEEDMAIDKSHKEASQPLSGNKPVAGNQQPFMSDQSSAGRQAPIGSKPVTGSQSFAIGSSSAKNKQPTENKPVTGRQSLAGRHSSTGGMSTLAQNIAAYERSMIRPTYFTGSSSSVASTSIGRNTQGSAAAGIPPVMPPRGPALHQMGSGSGGPSSLSTSAAPPPSGYRGSASLSIAAIPSPPSGNSGISAHYRATLAAARNVPRGSAEWLARVNAVYEEEKRHSAPGPVKGGAPATGNILLEALKKYQNK